MKKLNFALTAALIIGAMIFTACEKDDNDMNEIIETTTIAKAASSTPELSTLVSILTKYPDLLNSLSDDMGNFTVFAPTNEAFGDLLGVIGQTSAEDIPEDVLKSILQYHVLTSPVYSGDLSNGLKATTLNGEDIEVTMSGMSYLISGAGISNADITTDNGVVHIIDAVLVPPSIAQFVNTIVEPAYFNKSFTTLIAAVKAASPSILETLLGEGPSANGMTLFAPTNDAFTAAGITSLPDQATLDAVLTYHLIDDKVMSSGLLSTSAAAPASVAALGGNIYISNKGDGAYINGNTMITAVDIEADNGVVHVIDRTLLPPSQDIVALAIDAGFNKLAAALTEAGLVSTLQGDGPFTVFAPTDAAFDALYAVLGVQTPDQIDDETLDSVLKYHVLGLRAFSTDLVDQLAPATVMGSTFIINIGESGASIRDSSDTVGNITAVNVLATNGVIHVIDKVLLPE